MKRLAHLEKMAGTINKVYFMSDNGLYPKVKIISDIFKEKL